MNHAARSRQTLEFIKFLDWDSFHVLMGEDPICQNFWSLGAI